MIEANELRFGNLIDTISIKAEKVTGLSTNICTTENNQVSYDCAYPIPLTEEWLLKFGFEKYNDNGDYWELEGFKLWVSDPNKFYHINSELLVTPDYVHQLQNLYFALTGEELTIWKSHE